MATRDQCQGFEREDLFLQVLGEALETCPTIKAKTVKQIIRRVAPEFLEGLFEIRPCRRTLRYVGHAACGNEADALDMESPSDFFTDGGIYRSIDFTGATYSIEGYGDKRIGCAYFEWISDEEADTLQEEAEKWRKKPA